MNAQHCESSIRRKAARDGYLIRTIRTGMCAGELLIIDASMNIPVAGRHEGGLSWAEVEEWVYGTDMEPA
jgi:hypothetical protein